MTCELIKHIAQISRGGAPVPTTTSAQTLSSADAVRVLREAVRRAPDLELRNLVLKLYNESGDNRKLITTTLFKPAVQSGAPKRKAYAMCGHCHETYDAERNEKGGCVYHPGETDYALT